MTNKEILSASILDIIFENRNKDYGAYALRKGYSTRLLTALGAGMSVILLLVVINILNSNHVSTVPFKAPKEEVVIRMVVMPKEKPKEPEQPKEKEVIKQKPVQKLAEIKYTSKIKINKDNLVKEVMPPIENLSGRVTSTQTVTGIPADKKEIEVVKTVEEAVKGSSQPKGNDFVIQERNPEFPGGAEALRVFLARYLSSPDELGAGEKKLVKIRFKVDKDGSVNTFEIVTSGGNQFDNEVLRVCKKMPRWRPAIQNGINVPVSYVLRVTFIGMEE
ncbi:MAG: TonB family protein [Bacteroidota bacterium]